MDVKIKCNKIFMQLKFYDLKKFKIFIYLFSIIFAILLCFLWWDTLKFVQAERNNINATDGKFRKLQN